MLEAYIHTWFEMKINSKIYKSAILFLWKHQKLVMDPWKFDSDTTEKGNLSVLDGGVWGSLDRAATDHVWWSLVIGETLAPQTGNEIESGALKKVTNYERPGHRSGGRGRPQPDWQYKVKRQFVEWVAPGALRGGIQTAGLVRLPRMAERRVTGPRDLTEIITSAAGFYDSDWHAGPLGQQNY